MFFFSCRALILLVLNPSQSKQINNLSSSSLRLVAGACHARSQAAFVSAFFRLGKSRPATICTAIRYNWKDKVQSLLTLETVSFSLRPTSTTKKLQVSLGSLHNEVHLLPNYNCNFTCRLKPKFILTFCVSLAATRACTSFCYGGLSQEPVRQRHRTKNTSKLIKLSNNSVNNWWTRAKVSLFPSRPMLSINAIHSFGLHYYSCCTSALSPLARKEGKLC